MMFPASMATAAKAPATTRSNSTSSNSNRGSDVTANTSTAIAAGGITTGLISSNHSKTEWLDRLWGKVSVSKTAPVQSLLSFASSQTPTAPGAATSLNGTRGSRESDAEEHGLATESSSTPTPFVQSTVTCQQQGQQELDQRQDIAQSLQQLFEDNMHLSVEMECLRQMNESLLEALREGDRIREQQQIQIEQLELQLSSVCFGTFHPPPPPSARTVQQHRRRRRRQSQQRLVGTITAHRDHCDDRHSGEDTLVTPSSVVDNHQKTKKQKTKAKSPKKKHHDREGNDNKTDKKSKKKKKQKAKELKLQFLADANQRATALRVMDSMNKDSSLLADPSLSCEEHELHVSSDYGNNEIFLESDKSDNQIHNAVLRTESSSSTTTSNVSEALQFLSPPLYQRNTNEQNCRDGKRGPRCKSLDVVVLDLHQQQKNQNPSQDFCNCPSSFCKVHRLHFGNTLATDSSLKPPTPSSCRPSSPSRNPEAEGNHGESLSDSRVLSSEYHDHRDDDDHVTPRNCLEIVWVRNDLILDRRGNNSCGSPRSVAQMIDVCDGGIWNDMKPPTQRSFIEHHTV